MLSLIISAKGDLGFGCPNSLFCGLVIRDRWEFRLLKNVPQSYSYTVQYHMHNMNE
jgi:hypothetical protein